MECNKDEAARAKQIAENKFITKDIAGAKKFALKAQRLYPDIKGVSQMLATFDVYIAAENKVDGEVNWYGILNASPRDDNETLKKKYKNLCLMLHPDKNNLVGAEGAFKHVSEAWKFLSDKEKRHAYDRRKGFHKNYENVPFADDYDLCKTFFTSNARTTSHKNYPTAQQKYPTTHTSHPMTHDSYSTTHKSYPTFQKKNPMTDENNPTSHKNYPTAQKSHPTIHKSYPTTHKNHPTSQKNHPTAHENDSTEHKNNPPIQKVDPTTHKNKQQKSDINTQEARQNGHHTTSDSSDSDQSTSNTFWALCWRCKIHHEYLLTYSNSNVICPSCRHSFLASEGPTPGNSRSRFKCANNNHNPKSGTSQNTTSGLFNKSKCTFPRTSSRVHEEKLVQQAYEKKVKKRREEAKEAERRQNMNVKRTRVDEMGVASGGMSLKRRRVRGETDVGCVGKAIYRLSNESGKLKRVDK